MLYGAGLLFVVELGLLVFCVLDVIRTPEDRVRSLPKLLWLLLVIVLPLAGGIAWLLLGRPQGPQRSLPYKGGTGAVPSAYDRPGRSVASNPDDDAAFLASLKARADAQRAAAEEQRREQLAAEEAQRAADREARKQQREGGSA